MSSVRAAAESYVRRGWAPIPLPYRSKVPYVNDWPNLRITLADVPKYFNGQPQNIGVLLGEPSDGLVEGDVDTPEAIALAPDYLPATPAVFGHASKRRSHYVFRCTAPVSTHSYKDPRDGTEIFRLGSTGAQTVFPPSVHEGTGEPIEWDSDGEPAVVSPEELLASLHDLHCAVLAAIGVDEVPEEPAGIRGWQPAQPQRPDDPTIDWQQVPIRRYQDLTPYLRKAFDDELARVQRTKEGGRNLALNRAAFSLAAIAAHGVIDPALIVERFTAAGQKAGLGAREVERTIASAIRGGMRKPRASLPLTAWPHTNTQSTGSPTVSTKPGPRIEPYQPFPVHVLPEPMRSYVMEAARAIGCDQALVSLPLLAGLASEIGNSRRVELKPGWTEPAIVWAVLIAESGRGKSPAIEQALRAVRRRQRAAMKVYEAAMRQYAIDHLRYEVALAAWKRRPNGEPPMEPPEPTAERCWCDDSTVEALAVLLQQNPRGLLMVRDELSGWLSSFDRYAQGRGGDVAKWLEMHGGRPMVVDRKGGNPRTLYVSRAAVSIAGGIQPGSLRRALGEQYRENGLAARQLLAYPPYKGKRWTEAEIDPKTDTRMEAIFDALYALQPRTGEGGDPEPVILTLTSDGKAAWIQFYNEHAEQQAELTGDLAAAWAKLEGYAARLALIVHLVRCASGDTTPDPKAVDAASVQAGITLARWFGNEARRVYSLLAESDTDRARRQLVELIERKGGRVAVRDLARGSRLYPDATAWEAALQDLVDAGLGRWEYPAAGPKGGHPVKLFCLTAQPPAAQADDMLTVDTTLSGDVAA